MTPAPSERWSDPALLDHLARVRAPWDRLTRRIVAAALARFLPVSPPGAARLWQQPSAAPGDWNGPVVEIGAGGGQLREWLPPEVAAVTTHTEPSEPFLRALRRRFPEAATSPAEATALPFEPGTVRAVLGLCVLDTLADLPSVRDELRRVLRPGGVVLHFLDLATSPDSLFPELIAGGELPLTNFARDPALRDVLSDAQKAVLPPADDFDEVLAVRWDDFTRFAGMLEDAGHPLAADLGPYRGLHRPGGLDPERLARDFMAASADPARLLALNRALLGLTLAARGMGREWRVRAVSSRSRLRERLNAAFAPEHGFVVEFARPVGAWEVPAETLPSGVGFVLRHAGRTVHRAEVGEVPGTPVEELEGGTPVRPGAPPVRATTVEVFAARRV